MRLKLSDFRWTFGNHEPLAMYRRIGRKSTGGVQGGALWLDKWHNWYDSDDCAAIMEEFGFNILHCRFYKGLGWEHEKADFPAVKAFTENCHKHGIKVLAYTQFSSLYYEVMLREIPNLCDWAAVDYNGEITTYHEGNYFRWMPCVNNPEFAEYLERVIRIGLTEGGFDGILFDNAHHAACYCPRCKKLFREHIRERGFAFVDPDFVELPPEPRSGEIEDPIAQEMMRFRHKASAAIFKRLYRHIKSLKPDAIVSANFALVTRPDTYRWCGNDPLRQKDFFDIIMSQSGNEPDLSDGCVITQVREQKLAHALNAPTLTLNDSDGASSAVGGKYVCGLFEALFSGGAPVDRSIMKPLRGGAFNRETAEKRRPILARIKEIAKEYAGILNAERYEPVGVLYPAESQMFSDESMRNLLRVEESLLRGHLPYRILSANADGFAREDWLACETIIVPGQRCVADKVIESLRTFKGRIVLAGEGNGDYDENYCQRVANPFDSFPDIERLLITPHEILSMGWTTKIKFSPDHWAERFLLPVTVTAPPSAHAEIRERDGKIIGVLLTSPDQDEISGVEIRIADALRSCAYHYQSIHCKEDATIFGDTFIAPPFTGMLMLCAEE